MLVEKITEYLVQSGQAPRSQWSGIWNATDCTGCPRALVHIARGIERPAVTIDPWMIYKMQDGLLHEDDIKARIRLKGIKIEVPGAIVLPDAPIICHPDGLVRLDGVDFGLEIKSYGCEYFHNLVTRTVKRASPKYYRQMQIYMRATGIKHWILVAKDRDCCQIYEEVVGYDSEEVERLIDNVLAAQAVLNQNLDSQALPCGSEFLERLFCPFTMSQCGGPSTEIWAKEAIRAAEDWLWAKQGEAEMLKIIDSSRLALKAVLDSLGIPVMDVGGSCDGRWQKLRVYAKGQGRRVGDIATAEKLLTPDIFNQIYQYKDSPGPRIYRLRGDGESSTGAAQ